MITRAFVLHSGGIDSSTTLAMAVAEFGGDNVISVGVNYGQRHSIEMEYASKFADKLGARRTMLRLGPQPTSMLTDDSIEIPKKSYADLEPGISPTYVPFRNGQMLSLIAAYAHHWVSDIAGYRQGDDEQISAQIWFGAHAEDAANWAYPDCTPEFVGAMANAIFIGTYQTVRLVTPFIHSTKDEIVRRGVKLGIDYSLTWSCYHGGEIHCGECPTCIARKESFAKNHMQDPTQYAK